MIIITESKCSVHHCEKSAGTKGLCPAHYQRQRKTGDVQAHIPVISRTTVNKGMVCKFSECDRPAHSLGFCSTHAEQNRYERLKPIKAEVIHGDTCSFPRCEKPWRQQSAIYPGGLCGGHATQERSGWTELRPLEIRAPNGSGHTNKKGYRSIYINGKSTPEHRYVMEQFLGRKLFSNEEVHHRNGVRHDNRISNLEIKPTRHGAGQSIPDLIAYAHEILDRYEGTNVEQVPYDESRSANNG